eukprot:TRINITY_DN15006_c0_g1_i1.p1 TRINITY_DN15006_c0_g1~~TRINITY_DN15006_c0_g1_i1.p1  ORF type:complete len:541 (+),score=52.19 TRINITY_DN15006_c0_g1_i1:43-1665(+)
MILRASRGAKRWCSTAHWAHVMTGMPCMVTFDEKARWEGHQGSVREVKTLLDNGEWEVFVDQIGGVDQAADWGLGAARLWAMDHGDGSHTESVVNAILDRLVTPENIEESDVEYILKLLLAAAAINNPSHAKRALDILEQTQLNYADIPTKQLVSIVTVMGQLRTRNESILGAILNTIAGRTTGDPLNMDRPEHKDLVVAPRHLADVAWGLSYVYMGETDLLVKNGLRVVGDALCVLRNEGEREGGFKLAKKHSGISRYDQVMFRVPAKPYLALLPPSKITQALWAFAVTSTPHHLFVQHATEELVNKFEFLKPADLVAVSYALSKSPIFSPEFMHLHVKYSTQHLADFTPFQLAYLLKSYSDLFTKDPMGFDPSPILPAVAGVKYLESGDGSPAGDVIEDVIKGSLAILNNEVEAAAAGSELGPAASKNSKKKAAKMRKKVAERALKIPQVTKETRSLRADTDAEAEELFGIMTETMESNTNPEDHYEHEVLGYRKTPSKLQSIEELLPHGDPLTSLGRLRSARPYLPPGGLEWGKVEF